jgi:VIT1/CCC1 family predicted Fe2+/Mn2+ transporter
MGDNQFLNAQIDEDTELWAAFDEWKEEEGYESKSEAVRAAVRRGVMDEDGEKTYTSLEETFLTVASVIAGVVLFLPLLPFLGLASATAVSVAGVVYLALAAVIVVGVDFRARRREAPPSVDSSAPGVSN